MQDPRGLATYDILGGPVTGPPSRQVRRTIDAAKGADTNFHSVAGFLKAIVAKQPENIDARGAKRGGRLRRVGIGENNVARSSDFAPLGNESGIERHAVIGHAAGQGNNVGHPIYRLIWSGVYNGRRVVVHRTLAIGTGEVNIVDFLTVERTIIEADLIEHPGVRRALPLHVAEVQVVTGLRREAPEIALGLENPVDVELRYPARLIISNRIMAPHSAGPVAQVLLECRDFVADSIGIDKGRAQIALEVTLPLVEVSPPRAPVVPPYQHRRLVAVGCV